MVLLWQPGGVRVRQPLLRSIFDSESLPILLGMNRSVREGMPIYDYCTLDN